MVFFFLVKSFKIKIFQLRLGCVKIFIKIVETNQDHRDKLRKPWFFEIIKIFVETFWKNWISLTFCPFWSQFWSTKCKQKRLGTQISIEIFVIIHYFSVKIKKKIEKSTWITNNHKSINKSWYVSTSTEKYWICIWPSRQNWDISISIEISQLSRLAFWKCQDFLDCWDRLSASVEIKSQFFLTAKTKL